MIAMLREELSLPNMECTHVVFSVIAAPHTHTHTHTHYATALVNILNTSDKVTVENDQFEVNIQDGMPKVYSPENGKVAAT